MKKRFRRAIEQIQRTGYDDIAEKLEKELCVQDAETYRIAVVGEFKTGKSTLINRVFLKEDILFTDIMEATAVPTEICYGPEKCLEIFPYAHPVSPSSDPFDGSQAVRFDSSTDEGDPVRIANPGPEDIREETSAETPEARAMLTAKTARVRLFWPAENLDGLTLFDTPGINSLNAAVIATTYRILPEADLVLFVTGAKQLSNVEIEFLSGQVFSKGITRAIAVVTYDPAAGKLSETDRELLLNTIRNQLINIGRENIPVELVNIRDLTGREAGGFKERIDGPASTPEDAKADSDQAVSQVISSLLDDGPPLKSDRLTPPIMAFPRDSIAALEKKLVRFIRENVRSGRTEKAAQILRMQVQLALVRCEAELAAMEKDKTERRQMLADLRAREAEMRLEYEKLSASFREDMAKVREHFIQNVARGIDRVADTYVAGFDACEGLGELHTRLKNAQFLLKRDLEGAVLQCARQAETDMEALVGQYGVKSQVILNPWQAEVSQTLNINGGVLSRIPPFAVLAADIMLFVRFGPFGPLADILIRLLVNYIPLLNKALPVSLAAAVLKKKIRTSLTRQFQEIGRELTEQTARTFNAVADRISDEWNGYTEDQLNTVRKSAEAILSQPADNQERREVVSDVKSNLSLLLSDVSG